jgi:hypothetical protein
MTTKTWVRAAALWAVAVMAGTGSIRADRFQTFTGNTAGGPTFARPNDAGNAVSGSVVSYHALSFSLLGTDACVIHSTQNFDGILYLYQSGFNPGSPLTNLVDFDDDAELGQGTSRIPHDLNSLSVGLMTGHYILVVAGYNGTQAGGFEIFVSCNNGVQPLHGYAPGNFQGIPLEKQVWLHDRFVVAIDSVSNHAGDGIATPVRFGSKDSAFFWFYNDTNFEVLIKVLNACQINHHWWIFFAGTTNQAHRVLVGDTTTGQVHSFTRVLGPPSPAETLTVTSFPCPP